MKTSAESLLITISNAPGARQTREGEKEKKRGASERGRKGASGLSCAEARLAKLNEHQICTVSAGWVVERDRMVSRVFNYCKRTSGV